MITKTDAVNFPGSARASRAISGASPETPLPIHYSKRRLPHFERPWTIYAITISARTRLTLSPAARTIVLNALRHFHLDRYELFAACVMPDHVHFLFQPWPKKQGTNNNPIFRSIPELMHSLKSFTAHQINRLEKSHGPNPIFTRSSVTSAEIRGRARWFDQMKSMSGFGPKRMNFTKRCTRKSWGARPSRLPARSLQRGAASAEASRFRGLRQSKVRFGATPKPTPETGVLPRLRAKRVRSPNIRRRHERVTREITPANRIG